MTVAAKPEALTAREYQLLQIINELHQSSVVLHDLSPIAPTKIAEAITHPHQRQRLLQMAMVMAMVDGEIKPNQQKALRKLADELCVKDDSLRVLYKAATGHKLLVQVNIMRQLMSKYMGAACHQEGIADIKKIVTPSYLNCGEDPEIAWNYRQLGLLPLGTLGRTYWEHCTRQRFNFPGEVGGIPEHLVFHDFTHILSGYDTSSQGEIQQGAFQAGFIRENGFVSLLFVILHFHRGIHIELFDIQLVMQALQRGAACKVDFSNNWNVWEVVDISVEELRDRYSIPPLNHY
ncbi:hypothetical protein NUACC21_19370 [Scytonema sp. NUACC21]